MLYSIVYSICLNAKNILYAHIIVYRSLYRYDFAALLELPAEVSNRPLQTILDVYYRCPSYLLPSCSDIGLALLGVVFGRG